MSQNLIKRKQMQNIWKARKYVHRRGTEIIVTLRVTSPLWLWGPEELEVRKEYTSIPGRSQILKPGEELQGDIGVFYLEIMLELEQSILSKSGYHKPEAATCSLAPLRASEQGETPAKYFMRMRRPRRRTPTWSSGAVGKLSWNPY